LCSHGIAPEKTSCLLEQTDNGSKMLLPEKPVQRSHQATSNDGQRRIENDELSASKSPTVKEQGANEPLNGPNQ